MGEAPTIVEAAESMDLMEIISIFVAYAIIIAGFLSVVFIFFGGFSFILSGGQEDKIKQAVGTIRYAIIGLIVSILAIVIVGIIGKALGINIVEYLNPADIFDLVRQVTSDLDSGSSGSGIETLE